MYIFKKEEAEVIKRKYKGQYICDIVGISATYLSLILNRKKTCPKTTAYSITKCLNKNAEISKYFDLV
jgi:hypothetical protein